MTIRIQTDFRGAPAASPVKDDCYAIMDSDTYVIWCVLLSAGRSVAAEIVRLLKLCKKQVQS